MLCNVTTQKENYLKCKPTYKAEWVDDDKAREVQVRSMLCFYYVQEPKLCADCCVRVE
jgi:hypothetical protein